MDADTKPAAFSGRRHAYGLHRMVEMINAGRDPLDEVASGFGQPGSARMALEQEDARVLLERPDPRADARLADAECLLVAR